MPVIPGNAGLVEVSGLYMAGKFRCLSPFPSPSVGNTSCLEHYNPIPGHHGQLERHKDF